MFHFKYILTIIYFAALLTSMLTRITVFLFHHSSAQNNFTEIFVSPYVRYDKCIIASTGWLICEQDTGKKQEIFALLQKPGTKIKAGYKAWAHCK